MQMTQASFVAHGVPGQGTPSAAPPAPPPPPAAPPEPVELVVPPPALEEVLVAELLVAVAELLTASLSPSGSETSAPQPAAAANQRVEQASATRARGIVNGCMQTLLVAKQDAGNSDPKLTFAQ
jgi:hypothetical protein